MRVKKINSQKEVLINYKRFAIQWHEPSCSKLQTRTKNLLRFYWSNYLVLEEFIIPGSLLRIDFLNVSKRIAIEIDGPQHDTFNKHFYSDSLLAFKDAIKRDFRKMEWCEQNNIKLITLKEEDLDHFSVKYIEDNFGVNIL